MPYISVEEHLPGVTGLLEFAQNTAVPLRTLTQILLRGESTLTPGERELIATIVSHGNDCTFCATSHTYAANRLLGETTTCEAIKTDLFTAPISDKMKALLQIAAQVRQSGKAVTSDMISQARNAGATDPEIHDTVLIAALFCLYNRYVDGLATHLPTSPSYYEAMAERLATQGYYRPPQGYDHLKQQTEPA